MVRVFPPILGACATLLLVEPWRESERLGVRSDFYLRGTRFALALVVVLVAGSLLSVSVHSSTLLLLALAAFALLTAGVALVGPYWWVTTAPALYGQLFAADVEQVRPPVTWVAVGCLGAAALYLHRGESNLTRRDR